jgi:ADP-dependent NAD(P)H-hydrate dehydratase / NAD(P)H-hydrate epimerase
MANSQILTVEKMRAAEQALIDGGETASTLMERAGQGAAEWIWRMAAGRSVTVMCGPGNNGGDGYVIARVLAARGLKVNVVAPLEPKTAAARAARKAWGGEPVKSAKGGVFVDCLFGSGLARVIDPILETQLCELAAAHDLCVAVDVPSGIDCDSGEVLNDTLPIHDLTIALGAWKFAHWMMPAMQLMGERRLVDIGVPQDWSCAQLSYRPVLAEPEPDAHKYSRGMLAVIGGEMPGAAVLAATAAMRGGAGYVKLFADADPGPVPPELVVMTEGLDELLTDERLCALLVGPGLGRTKEARDRLAFVLGCDLPTVCDADALHLLTPDMLEGRLSPLIVTPHAGELDALGHTFGSVGLDRVEQVSDLAEALEGVVVAKGPDTMFAAPASPIGIMPPATSWLSTAGTGDVLAGLIASRMAVGTEGPMGVAMEGCWLHAEAARLAGPAFTAGDLMHYIPAAYRALL